MTLSTLVPPCVVCASRGSQGEVVKIKQAKQKVRRARRWDRAVFSYQ